MIKLPEPVAQAHGMPGSGGGFTMAAFKATDVPIGSDLQTSDQLKQAIRDALEEAAQLVEKATYRKRWAKAAVNSQASNVQPCELAAAIRKLKEDIQ